MVTRRPWDTGSVQPRELHRNARLGVEVLPFWQAPRADPEVARDQRARWLVAHGRV